MRLLFKWFSKILQELIAAREEAIISRENRSYEMFKKTLEMEIEIQKKLRDLRSIKNTGKNFDGTKP